MMLTTVHKLWSLFTHRERWQLVGALFVVLVMGILQVAGVGSVAPFIGLLTNPQAVHDNAQLSWAFIELGFEDTRSFLFLLGLAVLCVIAISNAFMALTLWVMTRLAWSTQYHLSTRLLEKYLSDRYEVFLERNSAEPAQNILQEAQTIAADVLLPLLRLVAFGTVVLCIIGFLLWFNPVLTGLAAGVVGGGYLLVFFTVRRILLRAGQRRMDANTLRYKAVDEAFGGIKETMVLGRQASFLAQFRGPARRFARAMTINQILAQVPRYVIEVMAVASLMGIVLYTLGTGSDLSRVITVVSVYAFAGYRILPALQHVYQGWSRARFNQIVVDKLYRELAVGPDDLIRNYAGESCHLPLKETLEVCNVKYTYPNASVPAVQGVSLIIPKGAFVAFIGATGAGKTTLVDIILGLLKPQEGGLKVDGRLLDDSTIRAWQNNVGYVPQDIYLADDTVSANIAFGIPPQHRDQEAVERAARVATIHDFVVEELPKGYDTVVGERGVRLSGGQRQRIGIARALYHDPDVLVLDEATSNLDQRTEAVLHKAIEQMATKKTVIMIAHRLSTTQKCDTLYFLDCGQILVQGSYEELVASNERFREMVGVKSWLSDN